MLYGHVGQYSYVEGHLKTGGALALKGVSCRRISEQLLSVGANASNVNMFIFVDTREELNDKRKPIALLVKPENSVDDVKARIHAREGIPTVRQRLTYEGKELSEGSHTLAQYGVKERSRLILSPLLPKRTYGIASLQTMHRSMAYLFLDQDMLLSCRSSHLRMRLLLVNHTFSRSIYNAKFCKEVGACHQSKNV